MATQETWEVDPMGLGKAPDFFVAIELSIEVVLLGLRDAT